LKVSKETIGARLAHGLQCCNERKRVNDLRSLRLRNQSGSPSAVRSRAQNHAARQYQSGNAFGHGQLVPLCVGLAGQRAL